MLNFVALDRLVGHLRGPSGGPQAVTFARTSDSRPRPAHHHRRSGHLGILFAAAAVPIVYWLLYRSTTGFEIRTTGANPTRSPLRRHAAQGVIILTMTLSGCSRAGRHEILGKTGYMSASYRPARVRRHRGRPARGGPSGGHPVRRAPVRRHAGRCRPMQIQAGCRPR